MEKISLIFMMFFACCALDNFASSRSKEEDDFSNLRKHEKFIKIFQLCSQDKEYSRIVEDFKKEYRQPEITAISMLEFIKNKQVIAFNMVTRVLGDANITFKIALRSKAALYVLKQIRNEVEKGLDKKTIEKVQYVSGIALAAQELLLQNQRMTADAAIDKIISGKQVILLSLESKSMIFYGITTLQSLRDAILSDCCFGIVGDFRIIRAGKIIRTEEEFKAIDEYRLHVVPRADGAAAAAEVNPVATKGKTVVVHSLPNLSFKIKQKTYDNVDSFKSLTDAVRRDEKYFDIQGLSYSFFGGVESKGAIFSSINLSNEEEFEKIPDGARLTIFPGNQTNVSAFPQSSAASVGGGGFKPGSQAKGDSSEVDRLLKLLQTIAV